MSRRWVEERRRDVYWRMAKEMGYRSRAAFKLIQIEERYGIFDGVSRVVDLGAAPGGWLQVAAENIGPDGMVVGVDLREIQPLDLPNVRTIVGDITDPKTMEEVRRILGGPADLVLSDASPNVSGVWEVDHERQMRLAWASLRAAEELLRRGGNAVFKLFEGPEVRRFVREVRGRFEFVKLTRPKATKKASSEIYVVAKGFRGGSTRTSS